jgi:hypothetical protein
MKNKLSPSKDFESIIEHIVEIITHSNKIEITGYVAKTSETLTLDRKTSSALASRLKRRIAS